MPAANFLTNKFTAFGFEFQNWMMVVAIGLVIFGLVFWLQVRNHG